MAVPPAIAAPENKSETPMAADLLDRIGRSARVEDILITDALTSRASRQPDPSAEARALHELGALMGELPAALHQRFVELAVELCNAGSAGISVLETDEAGETIFNEGDPGTDCYKIVEGSVEIHLRRRKLKFGEQLRVIAELGPGDVFGEMSIIDDAPRSASAVAMTKTRCKVYPADDILEILEQSPADALDIIRTLISRLRAANRKIARSG